MKKVMLSALLLSLPLLGYAQERFPSPEAAASAFAAAVAGKNETQLTALLGDDWRQFLPPEGADPEAVARFNRDWREGHRIVQKDNTAHLNVGREDWQLPVPMVKRLAAGALIWRQPGMRSSPVLLGEMNFLPYRLCMLTLMRSRTITYKTIAGRTG